MILWNFFLKYFWPIFLIMILAKKYVFRSKVFLLLRKPKIFRQPYLCPLLTYASSISSLVEPNQMMLDFLMDQLRSRKGKLCSWKQRPFVCLVCKKTRYLQPLGDTFFNQISSNKPTENTKHMMLYATVLLVSTFHVWSGFGESLCLFAVAIDL